jgi:6-phosphogluconolactonase (cycloisomerase 2 family)
MARLSEWPSKFNFEGAQKMDADRIRCLSLPSTFALALLALLLGACAQQSLAQGGSFSNAYPGAVYTLSNQPSGNSVIVFDRAADGTLTLAGSFPTGGTGVTPPPFAKVDPLQSQGAVVLSRSKRLLFAVSAGSNQVSAFAVDGDRLYLLNTISSGGAMPVSIAVHSNLLYVLNAGGTPNITGFTIDPRTNKLVPLEGSARPLAGGSAAAPAEVSFNLDGSLLMVTEKGTQAIDTYTVNRNGTVSGPISNHSSGSTPFGFEFTHRDLAAVSEAGPNALSSYRADQNGQLELITGSLADGQKAACWAVVTNDGRYAYTVNAGNGTVSSYEVSPEGYLTLLGPAAAVTGSGSAPTDPAFSSDGKFLYVRDGNLGVVYGYRVEADGSLTPVGTTEGNPAGGQGLAAR